MKKTLLILTAIIGLISCSKSDTKKNNEILIGNFTEVTPEIDRTTLLFSSTSNQLEEKRITDGDNSGSRTFSIRLLEDNMIELSSNEADEEFPRVFQYRIINDNRFEIGNINQNDSDDTIMVFERN